MTKAVVGTTRDGIVGVKTGLGPFSVPVSGQLPTRPEAPAAVTLTGTELTERIALSWTAPATDAVGDVLKAGAIRGYYVYYATGSGIDKDNSDTYDARKYVDGEGYNYDPPRPSSFRGPYYFAVTALDTDGGESDESNEINKTATAQSEGETDINDWGTSGNVSRIISGHGANLLIFRRPQSSWSRFLGYDPYYTTGSTGGSWTAMLTGSAGYPVSSFLHGNLNTGSSYKYKVKVVGKDYTTTTGTIHDNAGSGYQPNTTGNGALLSDTIGAMNAYISGLLYAETVIAPILQSPNYNTTGGSQFDLMNSKLRIGGSSTPGVYADGTGSFRLGSTLLVLDNSSPTSPTLTIEALFRTSTTAKRIQIDQVGSFADEIQGIDASNKARILAGADGFECYHATSGAEGGTAHRIAYIPSTTGTYAYLKHNSVLIYEQLVAGMATAPGTTDALYVSGSSAFKGDVDVTGALTVAAHSTGTVPQVVNTTYSTGSAPTGSVEGTIHFQWTP